MGAASMRPAHPARLSWLAPPDADPDSFARDRERLERIVSHPHAREVYTAKRRSIYRVEDEVLGPLGIKEMRNRDPLRSLRYGYLQDHRALREFRIATAFRARGGRTPRLLGAALERDWLGLRRALLFVRWLDGALTLGATLRGGGAEPAPGLLDAVAEALVDAARRGLVHGRHSSENLLVAPSGAGGVEVYVIDFAYSRLGDGLDPDGLVRDAARVAHRLLHDRACSPEAVTTLFAGIAARAWPDPEEAFRRRGQLARELAAALDATPTSTGSSARRSCRGARRSRGPRGPASRRPPAWP